MFRFEEPSYLYLLALVPLLILVHYYMNHRRHKRLCAYGDPDLLRQLMPDASFWRMEIKIWLVLIAFSLTVVVLARPQFGTKIDTRTRQGIEAVIAVDVSNSMMAEDVKPSRLDKAKMLFSNMVDGMTDDKVGLIVFAGDAFIQLPITSDYVSAKLFLDNMQPGMVAMQGTDLRHAIELAGNCFTNDKNSSKAIFIITDGEDHEGGAVEAAAAAADKGIQVYVLGIGSPAGAPIPLGAGKYLTDNTGSTVVTKLNEEMCREVAQAGNGAYIYVDNSSSAQAALAKHVDKLAKQDIETTVFSEYDEQFQAVALLAFLLLLIEVCIWERKNPFFSRFKIFTK
ncbi:MAG: VWA domain-containing protein [Clostridium sp.]|nr:VWA domain-containing protein [Clostridium sp.]